MFDKATIWSTTIKLAGGWFQILEHTMTEPHKNYIYTLQIKVFIKDIIIMSNNSIYILSDT